MPTSPHVAIVTCSRKHLTDLGPALELLARLDSKKRFELGRHVLRHVQMRQLRRVHADAAGGILRNVNVGPKLALSRSVVQVRKSALQGGHGGRLLAADAQQLQREPSRSVRLAWV